jgi:S-adenosylmethionine hydrolase
MARPFLSFLTDFGPDGPAPICRGVMLAIAPDAQIVDIAHHVRKYAIRDGAFLLWCAMPYLPVGVHVAVVDPGVGTARRPIAILTERGDALVGPDNGLLIPAAERLGGIREARVLENRAFWLASATSSTFHGRDIFAPVGAHLALGRPFADVGSVVPTDDLVRIPWPEATPRDGGLDTQVAYIDSFGNCRLAGVPNQLAGVVGALDAGRPLRLELGPAGAQSVTWQRTFGETPLGSTILYEDSFGTISLADNQGDVAGRLGLTVDQPVRIVPAAS